MLKRFIYIYNFFLNVKKPTKKKIKIKHLNPTPPPKKIYSKLKVQRSLFIIKIQGRSQELEMGDAKLLGEGSGGRLRPPVGPGQSLGRGPGGQSPPEALGF